MARPPLVAFVLGKPVRPETIFPAVFDAQRDRGLEPRPHLPHDSADGMPIWMGAAALGVRPSDWTD
jgi:hypothetical protein